MADKSQCEDLSEEISENVSQDKKENLEEMLSRHRKETHDLQNKEVALKKAAAKGSKAEQKAKKKQVDEEISQLSAKLKERQAEELASLGYNNSGTNGNPKGNLDNLVKAIAGVSVTNQPEQAKVSKSVKKNKKKAKQEADREQRIQEEQSKIVNERMIEDEKLEQKLEPLGFTINEIRPDGHCLYRAVEDQLSLQSRGSSPYTYLNLRQIVAAYMREHASDFLPFFLSENEGDGESEDSLAQRFENYCKEIESTAAWGGQLELGALTHCLKKHIMIFSGSFPDVEMGKEYKSGDASGFSSSSIMLSYHRHAFGLGEHYNSVIPISGVSPFNINLSDDTDDASPSQVHPEGVKKAKQKRKSGEEDSSRAAKVVEDSNRRIGDIMAESNLHQKRALEEFARIAQQKRDDKIMDKDLDTITDPTRREWYRIEQLKIMQKSNQTQFEEQPGHFQQYFNDLGGTRSDLGPY